MPIYFCTGLGQNVSMSENETKRLFFALEVDAPWPSEWPNGRVIDSRGRHVTLSFLGNVPWKPLEMLLPSLPLPEFEIGPVGLADKCLFLPPKHPHVVAYHVTWLEGISNPLAYQELLAKFLQAAGYELDRRPFLPHVTLARSPFDPTQWRRAFASLPIVIRALHLYESLKCLVYKPLWTHVLGSPFEEISHTADIAFRVKGKTMQQLGIHAQVALGFKFQAIMNYLVPISATFTLDDIVIALNEMITRADSAVGSPLKAVSFHGDVSTDPQGLLNWEMIVDV